MIRGDPKRDSRISELAIRYSCRVTSKIRVQRRITRYYKVTSPGTFGHDSNSLGSQLRIEQIGNVVGLHSGHVKDLETISNKMRDRCLALRKHLIAPRLTALLRKG